jgi:shikimate dehydrogenase
LTEFRKACVIGWPIQHSRSPLIHRFWLESYKIPGDYAREGIKPEDFRKFLQEMAEIGYCGGNVTLPHKEQALALCEKSTELARRVGAVNTLWFQDGRLYGDNTDVSGFLANLDEQACGWDKNCNHAVVLGAGGATRAVLAALVERKIVSVKLLNRSIDRAQQLAREVKNWGFDEVEVESLDPKGASLAEADILINATSLGMAGQPSLELDLGRLPDKALVSDIVYAPLETELLKAAKSRGLRTSSGLGMLLHQAAPGFEHWFGVKPTVTKELRSLIEADIQRGLQ